MRLHQMRDRFSPVCGRYHFRERRSFCAELSSIASPSGFFSRALSSSSDLIPQNWTVLSWSFPR